MPTRGPWPLAAFLAMAVAAVLAQACGSSSPHSVTKDGATDGGGSTDVGADANPAETGTDTASVDTSVDTIPPDLAEDTVPADADKDTTVADADVDAVVDASLDTNPPDAGPDAPPDTGAGPFYALDMNDVTILTPVPTSDATPVLLRGSDLADDGTALVPRVLFDRLTASPDGFSPLLAPARYAALHVIAVRFDLCDRQLPGTCPASEDGRMRLVFQPVSTGGTIQDAAFHAFYAIRNEEIGAAVATLRTLAKSVPAQTGALRVSPALSAVDHQAYAAKVRAFVKAYGGETRLVRLTMNVQPEINAQIRWALRGVEKKAGTFVDIQIAGSTETLESVITAGTADFDIMPVTDTPPGLLGTIKQNTFSNSDTATQREYLAALAAAENPLTHTAETVACVACHVSTFITNSRVTATSIDPLTLPGRYTSRFDLSVAAGKAAVTRATRALGYAFAVPLISQRVANETAQTLTEIGQRYPAP